MNKETQASIAADVEGDRRAALPPTTKAPWIPTVSPTQIEDWNLCERKWGFRQLVKSAYVQNIGAFRGEWGHKMLEAWGRDRTPPENLADDFALEVALAFPKDLDEKRISATDYASRLVGTVNKMLPLYPEPPWPAIERDFRVTIQGVVWAGRKDLEFSGVEGAIIDHKFTSSIEYAKTPEQLPFDPQALSYAFEKLYRESLPQVTVKLIYGLVSQKPRAWISEHTFTPEEAAENMRPHTEIAKKLVQLRLKRQDPFTLTPNWLACPHFNGCPFQDRCQPTPEQLIEAHAAMAMGEPPTKPKTGDSQMEGGLLSQLAGQSTARPATTNQAPALATTGAAVATEARSDSANAIADCIRDAGNLLRLGIARPEVVKAMQQRYVGIAQVVDSIVPMSPTTTAEAAPLPSVNSGPPPGVEAKPTEAPKEEKPKAAAKTKTAKEGTTVAFDAGPILDHVRALILGETNANVAAQAALALVQTFKSL